MEKGVKTMTIYHGSHEIVEQPMLEKGKIYNDYGQGFYCTEHIELAKEWACRENRPAFACEYELDLTGLKVLNLSLDSYSALQWLAILMNNRVVRLSAPVHKYGLQWLAEHHLIDISEYDVIIGYRADDSYFQFVRTFLDNTISLGQLERAMRLGDWGEQIVLKSEKAFRQIAYKKVYAVDNSIYYSKRIQRDAMARQTFLKLIEDIDLHGTFLHDLMKEGVVDGKSL